MCGKPAIINATLQTAEHSSFLKKQSRPLDVGGVEMRKILIKTKQNFSLNRRNKFNDKLINQPQYILFVYTVVSTIVLLQHKLQ